MAEFQEATRGISNFVTAPDFIPTVLIRNADKDKIAMCMEACRISDRVYNVYVETDSSNEEWVWRVERIADVIIDAQNTDPLEFFNK